MPLRKLQQAVVVGKRVLLRVDFNVLDKRGQVESDFRIRSAIPTIKHLLKKKAKIIIACHVGRPKGKIVPVLSLKPIAKRLSKLIKRKVILAPNSVGPQVEKFIEKTSAASLIMLENLRFHKEEQMGSVKFAKRLAQLADVFVNDAFGAAHRKDASVFAITRYLPSYAGLLMQKEIEALSRVRDNPKQPLVIIIGGAKASDKLSVIKRFAPAAHRILLAGAAANTFLKAHHWNIYQSLYEPAEVKNAHRLLHQYMPKVILPSDVVVAKLKDRTFIKSTIRETSIRDLHPGEAILDVGDYTYKTFTSFIRQAKTIFWAGPVGNTDYPEFAKGTEMVARAVAKSKAYSVVGGGETVAALEKFGLLAKISHASTGGGAVLEFLAGKQLPGIRALEVRRER